MILLVNKSDNRIYGCNAEKPQEEMYKFDKDAVWYEGEFGFDMADYVEGKYVEYFYEDGEIRTEYFDIPEFATPQPTQLDRIESAVNKSQEQIAQEARDAYTLELIEGGVIA